MKYVQEVPAMNLRREINFYAYMRGKTRFMSIYDATLYSLYTVEQKYTIFSNPAVYLLNEQCSSPC